MKNLLKPAVGITLLLAAMLAHADKKADEPTAGRDLFMNTGCTNCHEMSAKATGPSLAEIAKRYKGKNVADEVAARVREGSSGRWGDEELHPPQGVLEPAEAKLVVNWILNGAR